MNIASAFKRRAAKATPNYGGAGVNLNPLGATYADAYRKDYFPQPRELIQQLVGIAYGCVSINANAVASTPIRLYARTEKGQRKVRFWNATPVTGKQLRYLASQKETAGLVSGAASVEELKDHPILNLLDLGTGEGSVDDDDYGDTRPILSGFNLLKMTQIYLEAIGRAYWLIEKDGLGVPSKIWLLRTHLVREVFNPDGSGRIVFYEYGGPTGATYQPEQILRFCDPDPYNPYTGGMAPLIAAIEKLRIYRRQDAHVNAILENAARPDAIYSPKGDSEGGSTIGTAEARRVETMFNQKFREAGAGSIMVAPVPGTLQVIGWKPGDIVEIERARMLKSEIGFIFGVPDALMERNSANLASAKTADYAHAKYAVLPRVRSIVSTLRSLLRMYDPSGRLFFAADNVLPQDEVFALEQTRVGATTGAVEVDEIRMALDLEPYGTDAGKMRYIANDLVPIDRDGNPIGDDNTAPDPTVPPQVPPKAPAKRVRDALLAAGYRDDEAAKAIIAGATESVNHSTL